MRLERGRRSSARQLEIRLFKKHTSGVIDWNLSVSVAGCYWIVMEKLSQDYFEQVTAQRDFANDYFP